VKRKKTSPASVGDIARAAGVSRTTVALVLQNRPGVGQAMRERIVRLARKLNYAPDARMAMRMAQVREAKTKDLLPIAWLNTTDSRDSWQKYQFLSPYLEGTRERCLQLGYRLEEFWTQEPRMPVSRLSQILYQRGIEGAIVTWPARHLRLRWEHLAGVALGGALLAPRFHRVSEDAHFNLTLAIKVLRRHGYRRIGICLADQVDRFARRIYRTVAYHLYATVPPSERVKPLFHPIEMMEPTDKQAQIAAWLKRERPEVIIGHDSTLVQWVEESGYRVPGDIGVVHLAVDDDVLDWAGIYSKRREIGATAAEWLVALMRNRQFGATKSSLSILLRGSWHPGKTLLIPNPRQKR
jgi:LacI family transcriptional regulator